MRSTRGVRRSQLVLVACPHPPAPWPAAGRTSGWRRRRPAARSRSASAPNRSASGSCAGLPGRGGPSRPARPAGAGRGRAFGAGCGDRGGLPAVGAPAAAAADHPGSGGEGRAGDSGRDRRDMSRFHSAAHLASRACLAPGIVIGPSRIGRAGPQVTDVCSSSPVIGVDPSGRRDVNWPTVHWGTWTPTAPRPAPCRPPGVPSARRAFPAARSSRRPSPG
jgi:hypothetical protein